MVIRVRVQTLVFVLVILNVNYNFKCMNNVSLVVDAADGPDTEDCVDRLVNDQYHDFVVDVNQDGYLQLDEYIDFVTKTLPGTTCTSYEEMSLVDEAFYRFACRACEDISDETCCVKNRAQVPLSENSNSTVLSSFCTDIVNAIEATCPTINGTLAPTTEPPTMGGSSSPTLAPVITNIKGTYPSTKEDTPSPSSLRSEIPTVSPTTMNATTAPTVINITAIFLSLSPSTYPTVVQPLMNVTLEYSVMFSLVLRQQQTIDNNDDASYALSNNKDNTTGSVLDYFTSLDVTTWLVSAMNTLAEETLKLLIHSSSNSATSGTGSLTTSNTTMGSLPSTEGGSAGIRLILPTNIEQLVLESSSSSFDSMSSSIIVTSLWSVQHNVQLKGATDEFGDTFWLAMSSGLHNGLFLSLLHGQVLHFNLNNNDDSGNDIDGNDNNDSVMVIKVTRPTGSSQASAPSMTPSTAPPSPPPPTIAPSTIAPSTIAPSLSTLLGSNKSINRFRHGGLRQDGFTLPIYAMVGLSICGAILSLYIVMCLRQRLCPRQSNRRDIKQRTNEGNSNDSEAQRRPQDNPWLPVSSSSTDVANRPREQQEQDSVSTLSIRSSLRTQRKDTDSVKKDPLEPTVEAYPLVDASPYPCYNSTNTTMYGQSPHRTQRARPAYVSALQIDATGMVRQISGSFSIFDDDDEDNDYRNEENIVHDQQTAAAANHRPPPMIRYPSNRRGPQGQPQEHQADSQYWEYSTEPALDTPKSHLDRNSEHRRPSPIDTAALHSSEVLQPLSSSSSQPPLLQDRSVAGTHTTVHNNGGTSNHNIPDSMTSPSDHYYGGVYYGDDDDPYETMRPRASATRPLGEATGTGPSSNRSTATTLSNASSNYGGVLYGDDGEEDCNHQPSLAQMARNYGAIYCSQQQPVTALPMVMTPAENPNGNVDENGLTYGGVYYGSDSDPDHAEDPQQRQLQCPHYTMENPRSPDHMYDSGEDWSVNLLSLSSRGAGSRASRYSTDDDMLEIYEDASISEHERGWHRRIREEILHPVTEEIITTTTTYPQTTTTTIGPAGSTSSRFADQNS